jgi:DNA processing protein
LIKQGAKLVETAQDVMEELRIPLGFISTVPNDQDDDEPPEGDSSFLSALGFDIVSLDALQARTGLPTPALQAKLLELELDGFVMRLPGGLFQRMAAG